jgi:hypothetical protein
MHGSWWRSGNRHMPSMFCTEPAAEGGEKSCTAMDSEFVKSSSMYTVKPGRLPDRRRPVIPMVGLRNMSGFLFPSRSQLRCTLDVFAHIVRCRMTVAAAHLPRSHRRAPRRATARPAGQTPPADRPRYFFYFLVNRFRLFSVFSKLVLVL